MPHITIEYVILIPVLFTQIIVFPFAANMIATTWKDTQREAELQNAADYLASTIQQLYLLVNQKEISCAWEFSEIIGDASNTTLIDAESFEGGWPPSGWSETDNWARESDYAYDGTYSADFDGEGWGRTGNLETPDLNCSNAIAIYVSFYFREDVSADNEFRVQFWNGVTWVNIEDLGQGYSPGWHLWEMKVTDSQYFKSDFKIQWRAYDVESGEHAYVDLVTVEKEELEIIRVGNITQITQASTLPQTIQSYPYTATGSLKTADSSKVLTLLLELHGTKTTATATTVLGPNVLWMEESEFQSTSLNASIKVQKFANGTLLFSFGS